MRQISEKEKQLLLPAAAVILAVLCFGLIIFGSIANAKYLASKLPVKKSEYAQILKLSAEFEQVKAVKITALNAPPMTYLGNKIKELNLNEKLVSLRPLTENESNFEAKFENLSGNQTVKLLYELQRLPFTVKQLSLKDYENDNLWTLKLILFSPRE